MTVAPHSDIFSDGLRLRIAGGYGGYTYVGQRRGELVSFTAETAFGEALVGYLKRLGPLTAKAFVGVAAIEHDVQPLDPENPVQGQEVGPKLVAEFWLNIGSAGGPPSTSRGPARIRPPRLACAAAIASSGMSPSAWKAASTPTILARMRASACSPAMPGMAERYPSLAAFPAASWRRRSRSRIPTRPPIC